MDGFQIRKLVVGSVYTDAKEKTSIAAVNDTVCAELDEVGLVFLISGCDETVHLLNSGM